MLLINLDYWREYQLTSRLIRYIEDEGHALIWHDQDAINAVLHKKIRKIPLRWNYQISVLSFRRQMPDRYAAMIEEESNNAVVIHYNTGRKPWLFVMITPRKSLYWRYLRMTDWRDQPAIGRSIGRSRRLCSIGRCIRWDCPGHTTDFFEARDWEEH